MSFIDSILKILLNQNSNMNFPPNVLSSVEDAVVNSVFDVRFYVHSPFDSLESSLYLKYSDFPRLEKMYNQEFSDMFEKRYFALLLIQYKILEMTQPKSKTLLNMILIQEIEKIRRERDFIAKMVHLA